MPVGDRHCRLLERPRVGSRFPTPGRIDLRVTGVGSWFPTLGRVPLGEGWKRASHPRRQRFAGTRVGSVLPTLAQTDLRVTRVGSALPTFD